METLPRFLFDWAQEKPDQPAQMWKKDGAWTPISAKECAGNVEALARYLIREGLESGDVGLIYAYNSPRWVQLDLALMLARASSAGIYVNASSTHVAYIIEHSQAKFLAVDRLEDARRVFGDSPRAKYPALRKVIVFQPEGPLPEWAVSFADAVGIGKMTPAPQARELLEKLEARDRACLIYTSGTTGLPKAVELSHGNLAFAARSYSSTWDPPKEGRMFSFLPLAHIAERMANMGIGLTLRYAVYFCSSPLAIGGELKEVNPTILLCVPRLWDKLKEGTEAKLTKLPEKRLRLVRWAMTVGKAYWDKKLLHEFVSPVLALRYFVANRLVLRKFREGLGIDEARRWVSGAAALSPATLEWFRSIGVVLIEAYALSETTGTLCCGSGEEDTAYTVGIPYPGLEFRLAPDGEIETRGPHVFQGYFKDTTATAEVLRDGWLRTGDLGKIDERGYLKIVGRKREIIKSGEGKMISPLAIEAKLSVIPGVDQAIVIGNERPHLVAILTLAEALRPGHKGDLVTDARLIAEVQDAITRMNRDLASHERVKAFRILTRGFSIENDEMTATMKLKRHVIDQRYKDLITAMYDAPRGSQFAVQP